MVDGIKEAHVEVKKGIATIESESELDLAYLKEEIEDMGFDFLGKEES